MRLFHITGIGPFIGAERVHGQADITAFHQSQRHGLRIDPEFAFRIVSVHLDDAGEGPFARRHIEQRGHEDARTALIDQFRDRKVFFPDHSEFFHLQRQRGIVDAAEFFPQDAAQFFLKFPQVCGVVHHIQLVQLGQPSGFERQQTVDLAIFGHVQMKEPLPRIGRQIIIPDSGFHKIFHNGISCQFSYLRNLYRPAGFSNRKRKKGLFCPVCEKFYFSGCFPGKACYIVTFTS